jgi:heme/copper-type cytochrome/quinol oxidase subunit 3
MDHVELQCGERRPVLDVSRLPTVVFGPRNVTWLGNVFYMMIEGAMFAFVIVTYFYLRTRSAHWPPENQDPPALRYGIANAIVLLASLVPARWIQLHARKFDRRSSRGGLALLATFGAIAIVLRVFEFRALHCRWSDSAYASSIWILLGMHTGHLITNWIETAVLFAISCTRKMEGTRIVDTAINSDYWYFVVATAMASDLVIYAASRLH